LAICHIFGAFSSKTNEIDPLSDIYPGSNNESKLYYNFLASKSLYCGNSTSGMSQIQNVVKTT
jgi:hypothetical protein